MSDYGSYSEDDGGKKAVVMSPALIGGICAALLVVGCVGAVVLSGGEENTTNTTMTTDTTGTTNTPTTTDTNNKPTKPLEKDVFETEGTSNLANKNINLYHFKVNLFCQVEPCFLTD